ncbi:hypothetical protein [Altererythrobacter sp.]|uniref:hypothetical protein n=1 Tax=Altererythrobacter sp. TaxID=1872480 RepID=UPI001B1271B8|nr:hypothetical protein [Altererythrobacter sp.]MBO6609933.1 hypothetical protein [Altererythrobacter sp.]MBO6641697.1 hypothetical protein [Altererythrobacter sp.]MBO6707604.1 hypothetical protein [Altererythrobacter sp.]MBO6946264.1 hypothetical protein [Altererythrobacter sp.]
MTYKGRYAACAAVLSLLAAPLSAAIYVKIPPIKGESQNAVPGVEPDEIDFKAADNGSERKDSGEAHLDYLVITMEQAQRDGTELDDIGVRAQAESVARQSNEATHVVQQRAGVAGSGADGDANHDKWINVLSWSAPMAIPAASPSGKRNVVRARTTSVAIAPRDAATGRASGKRQHRPFVATKPVDKASPLQVPVDRGPGALTMRQAMEGCRVGASYSHILVGDDAANREFRLEDVTVASCATEEVTFNYEKIR